MNKWEETYLKDVCELITKGTTPTSVGGKFTDHGIIYIKSESLNYEGAIDETKFSFIDEESNEKLKRSILKENDILFSIAGIYLGKIGIVKKEHLPANTNQACAIVRLKHSEVDYRFIKQYFLEKSFINHVNSLTGQAAQPNINLTDIGNLKLLLPPLAIQKGIASILSAYDELIEINSQQIKLLEETARELYKEWFVRMRFPGYKKAKFVKGVPEGWEIKKLGEISEQINRGISPHYDENGASLVLNQRCIRENRIDLDIARKQNKIIPKNKLLVHGDVLINSTGEGTLGRTAQFNEIVQDLTADSHLTIARPKKGISKEYYGLTICSFENYFESMAMGSTGQTELGRKVISDILIKLPPNKLLEAFSKITSPINEQIILLLKQNSQLQQIRDRLLPRLISGKLPVKMNSKSKQTAGS